MMETVQWGKDAGVAWTTNIVKRNRLDKQEWRAFRRPAPFFQEVLRRESPIGSLVLYLKYPQLCNLSLSSSHRSPISVL